jgi:hypothetical protein
MYYVMNQTRNAISYNRCKTQNCLGLESWNLLPRNQDVTVRLRKGEGTKETGNRNATAISEKNRRFQAGNWFPD